MKRRFRDISVFSISAIDLFACAMGAFVVISLILLENKSKKGEQSPINPNAPLKQKVKYLEQALAAAKAKARQLEQEAHAAQAALEAQEADSARNRQLAFLGIVTECKSFVILLDMSGSMNEYEHLARKTLSELVGQMNDQYHCQIIGYQGDQANQVITTQWQQDGKLASMSPSNVTSALAFGDSLIGNFGGSTPTFHALKTALNYNAEAIFIMTDGEPTDVDDWKSIVHQITRMNNGSKKIYSVAIGNYRAKPELVEFLEELARKNKGKFLGVSD
jgi:Mg-chelatase subunit ChlD